MLLGKYGLPLEVKFCKKCVISNQRPCSVSEIQNVITASKESIQFGEDGVCSACHYQEEMNKIDWDIREIELLKLLEQYRDKTGKNYDVIVPGSGGKDSAFTAHILKYKYGMNPLTVTWAPHLYTNIGWENFQNWMSIGGLDNLLYTPNGRLHRLLTKLAFQQLGHPFQPFIIGQKIVGPRISAKFGVPLIMYGENPIIYGNQIKGDVRLQDTTQWISNDPWKIYLGGSSIGDIASTYGFEQSDFASYVPLSTQEAKQSNTVVHYLGYYLKWIPQDMYYYACHNTGFKPNVERTEGSYSKYSSIDDKTDPFHYYTTLVKFGLGRASYDAAQEIRTDFITREEGVQLVKRYDQEFPQKYFDEFLDYVSLTFVEFWNILNQFRTPHLWEKIGNEPQDWKLKYVVE